MAERVCISCPKSAGAEGVMPFGWDIVPVYLRVKGKKEHARTIFKCPNCVKKSGIIPRSYIDMVEEGIRKEYYEKKKKRKK